MSVGDGLAGAADGAGVLHPQVPEQFVLPETDPAAMGEKQEAEEGFHPGATGVGDFAVEDFLAPRLVVFLDRKSVV